MAKGIWDEKRKRLSLFDGFMKTMERFPGRQHRPWKIPPKDCQLL
ncbi:hypothetical protein [Kineothrix sp. MB12-C1]|nr:hypothetical protein [Kineothrix sp. MB12-C1]WMC92725.1 hypothetical protein RBB56_00080 [Kineothrix sp. MB12-C1]